MSASSWSSVSYGRPGTSASGSGTSSNERPRFSLSRRASRSTSVTSPALLRRIGQRVLPGALHAFAPAALLEPADRVGVLHELLQRHLDAVEESPPDRLALADVVVEQLRRELLPRVEQLRAQRRALYLLRRRRFDRLWLRAREGPELRNRVVTQLQEPVAQEQRRDAVLPVVGVELVE